MFTQKIKYFLYGMIASLSLVSVITYASGTDGVFGDYFERITGLCAANSVITWFEDASGTFGTKNCTTISSLVGSLGIFNDAGNIGIGTNTPSAKLEVVWDIAVSGKVCSWTAPNSVCLDKQKWDPMYLTGVVHYTGTMPTNNATTGILGQWIKAEWDNYGRAGCQAYATLYGTWTPTDVINCQSAYPWDGNSLTATINRTRSEAELLNMTWYQIMWWNPWIPHDCVSLNIVYICDGATNCWAHPSWTDYMTPDFLQYTCISK